MSCKYLNSTPCDPRPEFDRWICQHRFPPSSTTLKDPTLNVGGTWTTFNGYTTQITADYVNSFIRSTPNQSPVLRTVLADEPSTGRTRRALQLDARSRAPSAVV